MSTTSYAVLGLLTFGEGSGYDVLKRAETSVGYFWAPAKSHVYTELRRLAAAGLATEAHVEQEQRPDKRVYDLTDEGRAALRVWLEETPPEPEQFKSPFLLRLFFGALADRSTLLALVEDMRSDAVRRLEELRAIEAQIAGDDAYFYPNLTLRSGLLHGEATVRWCDEVIERFHQRGAE